MALAEFDVAWLAFAQLNIARLPLAEFDVAWLAFAQLDIASVALAEWDVARLYLEAQLEDFWGGATQILA